MMGVYLAARCRHSFSTSGELDGRGQCLSRHVNRAVPPTYSRVGLSGVSMFVVLGFRPLLPGGLAGYKYSRHIGVSPAAPEWVCRA